MLRIKLARFGQRKQPHYRMVINEDREKRDGAYVESIGHYAPTQTPKVLEIDVAKFDSWVAKGASPTDTVQALYNRYKSGNPFPAKKAQLSKKAKAKLAAAAEEKAAAAAVKTEAKAEVAPEAPAAEPTPTVETPAAPAAEAQSAEAAPAAN